MAHPRVTSLLQQPLTEGDDFWIIGVLPAADDIVCEWALDHRPERLDETAFCYVLLDEGGPA